MSTEERRAAIAAEAAAFIPLLDAIAEAQPRARCEALLGDYYATVQDFIDRWPTLSYADARRRLGDGLATGETLGRQIATFELDDRSDTATCLKVAVLVTDALLEAGSRIEDWELIMELGALTGRSSDSPPTLLRTTQPKLDTAANKLALLGPLPRDEPWSPILPRSEAEVSSSVLGGLRDLVCHGEVGSADEHVEACDVLGTVLIGGVTVDEEADLYEALRALTEAQENGFLTS